MIALVSLAAYGVRVREEDTTHKTCEELFLLSTGEAKGKLVGAAVSYLPYGLAGAILAELALLEPVMSFRPSDE